MRMSRRQFFREFTGKEGHRRQLSRAEAVNAYVRTNLLPYDFCLTEEQVEQLLQAVRRELSGGEGSEFSSEERQRMAAIAQETIRPWREDYWKAEEKRREAVILVREFLDTEAAPEALERMRNRFQIPPFGTLKDEIEGRARSWLYESPDARLAPLNAAELKDLVFSEMSTWGQPDPS